MIDKVDYVPGTGDRLDDIVKLQSDWEKLVRTNQLTKKNIVQLVRPFAVRYELEAKDAYSIARKEYDIITIFRKMSGFDWKLKRKECS